MNIVISKLKHNLDSRDTVLFSVALVFAVLFIALLVPCHPYTGSFIIKVIPVLCLALICLWNVKGIQGKFLFLGLLCSGAGDVTLDIDRVGLFRLGLVFFLLAHALYIAAFSREFQFNKSRLPIVVALFIYALILGIILKIAPENPIPAKTLIPVMGYLITITLMAIFAAFISEEWLIIFCGAVVFMISDTIIAINKFLHPIPHSTVFNIGIYFIAQFIIVGGYIIRKK